MTTTQEPEAPYLKIKANGNKRLVDTLGITQKLDREGGNASDVKVGFNDSESVEGLKSGNTLAKLFGAIKKWLSDIQKKLDGIEAGANNYTHPTTTARSGYPTGNQTPGFGSTFTVGQVANDANGHVSSITSRTVKIPDAVATDSAKGLMSAADKKKVDGAYIYYMARVKCDTANATATQVYNPAGVSAIFNIEKVDGHYTCKTSIGRPAGYAYAKPMILGESSGTAFVAGHTGTGSFNVYIVSGSSIDLITQSTFTIVMIAHN